MPADCPACQFPQGSSVPHVCSGPAFPGSAWPAEVESALLADLVSAVGIAQRAGVALNTVSVWQRRYPSFPAPLEAPGVVDRVAEGQQHPLKLWRWSEVSEWLEARKAKAPAS